MTRQEYMKELEFLLCGISEGEREEALQYYNDYFDDAGVENEEEVIATLGEPKLVAENIRKELSDGKAQQAAVTAADRAVVEYGTVQEEPEFLHRFETKEAVVPVSEVRDESSRQYQNNGGFGGNGFGGAGQGGQAGYGGQAGQPGQPGRSVIGTLLIIFALIVLAPVLIGLACGVFGVLVGLLAMWFAIVVAFGAVALAMFLSFVVCMVVGVLSAFVNPIVGVGVIGAGFVCGAIGLLFLMMTVGLTGTMTPAIFRGLGKLFRRKKKNQGAAAV